ncbi:MAG: glycosyltransferase family protein [Dehalococcoidia bacterium]
MVKRLMIYARGTGLGHQRRTRNIALEVLSREPECSVLILVDENAAPFFEPVSGIDYIRLPQVWRTEGFNYRSDKLKLSIEEVIKLRVGIILQTFRVFQPEVVLADYNPIGPMGELKEMLDEAVHSTHPPRLYFGSRDIIDLPEVIQHEWTQTDAYGYLGHYDGVLVYGSQDIYDTDSAYHFSSHAREVIYCNYVAPIPETALSDQADDDPIVLVMSGSGRWSFPIESAFVKALPLIDEAIPFHSVVLTGPNMEPEEREQLAKSAQSLPYSLQVLGSVKDAIQLIRRAALIVSMGGYNSLGEILQLRKKALIVPKFHRLFEQEMRVQLFAERGLIKTLPMEDLTPETLAQGLLQLYQTEGIPNLANLPKFDGAQRAAKVILDD